MNTTPQRPKPRIATRATLGALLTLTLCAPATLAAAAAETTNTEPTTVSETAQAAPIEVATELSAPSDAAEALIAAPAIDGEHAPLEEPLAEVSAHLAALDAEPHVEAEPLVEEVAEDAPAAPVTRGETVHETTAIELEPTFETPAAPAGSAPALPSSAHNQTYLVPPNTAKYVTFTIEDEAGQPVKGGVIWVPGVGERVVDANGQATFMSMAYGDYDYRVFRPNGRLDLVMVTEGSFGVDGLTENTTVVIQAAWGTHDRGFLGSVTDAVTGQLVRNATIYVRPLDNSEDQRTINLQGDGTFSVVGLSNKPYRVHFESEGYASFTTELTPVAGGLELEVELSQNRDFVTGFVRDPAGTPVVYATIEFIDPVTSDVVKSLQTSTNGAYTSYITPSNDYGHLEPGDYLVRVVPPANTDLVPTYWPSSSIPNEAVTVTLPVGIGVKYVDITLLEDPQAGAPIARDDAYSLNADIAFVVDNVSGGLLANDSGQGGLVVVEVAGQGLQNGTFRVESDLGSIFTVNVDGRFTYIPAPGFNGVEAFTYRMIDGSGVAAVSANVVFTVGDPDMPVTLDAVDDAYATPKATALEVAGPTNVLANDAAPTGSLVTELQGAALTDVFIPSEAGGEVYIETDGDFTYRPAAGFEGVDSFTYQLSTPDGAASDTATVRITVGDPKTDEELIAVDDDYSAKKNTPLVVDNATGGVVANDSGEGALRVVGLQGTASATPPFEATTEAEGTITMDAEGRFTYLPKSGFTGVDTFTYLLDDESDVAPATATVHITVSESDAPQPTPTPTSAPTPTSTATDSGAAPGTLPQTGVAEAVLGWAVALGVALMAAGAFLVRRRPLGR